MRGPSRLDEDFEEGPHYRITQAHGRIMLDRLAKLLQAGYRVDLRYVHEGLGLPLKHPNKAVPALGLWDDGLHEGTGNPGFLMGETVPRPS